MAYYIRSGVQNNEQNENSCEASLNFRKSKKDLKSYCRLLSTQSLFDSDSCFAHIQLSAIFGFQCTHHFAHITQ